MYCGWEESYFVLREESTSTAPGTHLKGNVNDAKALAHPSRSPVPDVSLPSMVVPHRKRRI